MTKPPMTLPLALACLGSLGCFACGDEASLAALCESAAGSDAERARIASPGPSAAIGIWTSCDDEGLLCSGVLVAPTLVLTAGHCVPDCGESSMTVYFGPDLRAPHAPSVEVLSWHAHPTQDLAALELAGPAPDDATTLQWTADLPTSRHVASLTVTGYGGPEDDVSRCLRVTEGIRDVAPSSQYGTGADLDVWMDGSTWPGDSGGPLVFDDGSTPPVLVGILWGTTGYDSQFGSLDFVSRLLADDPWLRQYLPGPPRALP